MTKVRTVVRLRRILAQAIRLAKNPARRAAFRKARAALPPVVKPTPPTPPTKPTQPPAKVTTWPGIRAARAQSETGKPFHGEGWCLVYVQECFGIKAGDPGVTIAPDAIGAWRQAKVKHPETDPVKIPRGYPMFWSGGSAGHGHIAISAGGGFCWSTDIKRIGFFDRVPVTQIHAQWGLTLLGWTEDLEGVTVQAVK